MEGGEGEGEGMRGEKGESCGGFVCVGGEGREGGRRGKKKCVVWFVLWVLSFWKCVCLCLSLFGREEWDSLCCVLCFWVRERERGDEKCACVFFCRERKMGAGDGGGGRVEEGRMRLFCFLRKCSWVVSGSFLECVLGCLGGFCCWLFSPFGQRRGFWRGRELEFGRGREGRGREWDTLVESGQARALPLHEGLRDPSFREGEGEGR